MRSGDKGGSTQLQSVDEHFQHMTQPIQRGTLLEWDADQTQKMMQRAKIYMGLNVTGQNSKGKSLAKANTTAEETKEPDSVWLAESVEDEDPTSSSLSYATLVQDNSAVSNEITELYNSGASQHMLSAHTHFVDFITIPPKPI